MPSNKPAAETPITTISLARWIPIFLTAVTLLTGAIWFASNQAANLNVVRTELHEMRNSMELRLQQDEKNIEANRVRNEQTDRNVDELSRKLDVAVTILQRLDKKLNTP